MKIDEKHVKRALTIMGEVNNPLADQAVQFATTERSVWSLLWIIVSHPRQSFLGFMDGIRHPENYR